MRKTKLIITGTVAACVLTAAWFLGNGVRGHRMELKDQLSAQLTQIHTPPSGTKADIIYLLGGPPDSLRQKFRVAAASLKKGVSDKVWFLSRVGITKYSLALGRNLTYDEWSLERLKYYGAEESQVEPVRIDEGFFGTLSEARSIPEIMEERGLKSVLVIAAPYHTARVKASFEKFMEGRDMSLYIISSGESGSLGVLLKEYCKLMIYKYFLL